MTKTNDESSIYHLLVVRSELLPSEMFPNSDGFRVSEVETIEDLRMALNTTPCDVVIAESTVDTIALYENLREDHSVSERPLLCMLDASGGAFSPAVDLYVFPQHLSYQLNTHLEMRQTIRSLESKCHDLSGEIKDLETQLSHEKRMRDEVALLKNAIVRNVSHELKTPLLQVKSAVSLLAEDIHDEKLIEYATGATARLETVIKNITMLGGSLEINPGPVIVREALEFARRNLRRVWEHRDHTQRIVSNLPPNLPPVFADKQGLSTAFQLLLDNALKFSDANVSVSAAVDKETERVLITVEDQGIGIDENHLGSIFDTFYQIDASSTRNYGGTGVGLAIVKLILDNHGSRIKVESKIGKGSRFTFDMPIVKIDES